MLSDEYLKKVTLGNVRELNGKIILCDYNKIWVEFFQKEKIKIERALREKDISVEHIGSTSVPGLCAKPIIDILLLVEDSNDEKSYVSELEKEGYILRIREVEWYSHRMMKKYDPEVNLHIFSKGCVEAKRMIDFRDWLRNNREDMEKYSSVKKRLEVFARLC